MFGGATRGKFEPNASTWPDMGQLRGEKHLTRLNMTGFPHQYGDDFLNGSI
jgi:hypothetical protein